MTVLAAICREHGKQLQIEEVALEEPRADEILVRMVAAGICHTDISMINSRDRVPVPIVLGHEGAGVVERVGEVVTDLAPGDHVVLSFGFCGCCRNCVQGSPYHCEHMHTLNFGGSRLDGTSPISQKGETIHGMDVDRKLLLVVLAELKRISRGDRRNFLPGRVPVNIHSKSFLTYYRRAHTLFNRAQRERNDFVKANLRLVVSIARRFNHGRMPLNDLIQEGNIGLIKAVERYDYHRGYRFSTYASWWIRHAISRALADKGRAVRLPVHMLDAYQKVSRAFRELSSRLGRPPTVEEMGSYTKIGADKVGKILGCMSDQNLSLDRSISEGDDRRFVEMLSDPDAISATDWLMERSMSDQVHRIMSDLKPIESDVLRKRFGLEGTREQTLKEIGDTYDLSRERIRQIQEQALGKIRLALRQKNVI